MSYPWLLLELAVIAFLCYQVYTVRHAIWGPRARGDQTDDEDGAGRGEAGENDEEPRQ